MLQSDIVADLIERMGRSLACSEAENLTDPTACHIALRADRYGAGAIVAWGAQAATRAIELRALAYLAGLNLNPQEARRG